MRTIEPLKQPLARSVHAGVVEHVLWRECGNVRAQTHAQCRLARAAACAPVRELCGPGVVDVGAAAAHAARLLR
jgi:hypothetical protein